MRVTRIIAALTFLSVAGAAHADWPFIKGNNIDDFTQPEQSTSANLAQQPAPAADVDRATLPDCCKGMRADLAAPAPVTGAAHFDGDSKG